MDDLNRVVSARMKIVRQSAHMSQKEVAARMGISPRLYSKYELGMISPPLEKFVRFCDVMNVSSDYLLGVSNVVQSRKYGSSSDAAGYLSLRGEDGVRHLYRIPAEKSEHFEKVIYTVFPDAIVCVE